MLSGAPCSGKTTVTPGLRAALPGTVIFDLDDFLDAGSRLAGIDLRQPEAADRWPAQNDLCLTFASAVLGAGLDVLLLSPLTPAEVGRSTAAPALGAISWAVLDCSDAERLRRLRARGVHDADEIDGALTDAAEMRELGLPVLTTDDTSIDTTVQHLTRWTRNQLSRRTGDS